MTDKNEQIAYACGDGEVVKLTVIQKIKAALDAKDQEHETFCQGGVIMPSYSRLEEKLKEAQEELLKYKTAHSLNLAQCDKLLKDDAERITRLEGDLKEAEDKLWYYESYLNGEHGTMPEILGKINSLTALLRQAEKTLEEIMDSEWNKSANISLMCKVTLANIRKELGRE